MEYEDLGITGIRDGKQSRLLISGLRCAVLPVDRMRSPRVSEAAVLLAPRSERSFRMRKAGLSLDPHYT